MKFLLVEDEAHLSLALTRGLRAEGFVIVTAGDGIDGLWRATHDVFDAVILDIMLPGLNGYEVLRQMRFSGIRTPVMMLTAKDGEYEETDALEMGADDYLTKPFSFRVLVARLRALVRRSAPTRPRVLTVGSLQLDPAQRSVRRNSTVIALTPREYDLLHYLMLANATVVSRADILANVWDANYSGPDNVVEVYIRYLRRKIDIPFGLTSIETIRGAGYRLSSQGNDTVTRVPPPGRSSTPMVP